MTIRPLVNSWDVFDTLLTRFVPEPKEIWTLVGEKHPGLDFASRRLEAQIALDRLEKPYVIYDIYARLVELGLEADAADALLAEELATEKAMMLPVRSAVEQVAPGDLLISDMYLPGEIVGALLAEVCDLHWPLPVIRSNWGKHSGSIWPKILRHYIIRTHYGDHPRSDVAIPQHFSINAVQLRAVDATDWEQRLGNLGLQTLALILRETRLRSLRADASLYENLAAGPYLGLLLGYAGWLAGRFDERAAFVFLSRDCDDLGRVFRTVFPAMRSSNLDLSRRLTHAAANDALFEAMLDRECVLVDGVSTGRSVARLLGRIGSTGRQFATLLFLDHLLDAPAISGTQAAFVFKSSDFGGRHFPLELLLQSAYPPVAAIEADAASGGLVRAFGAVEFTGTEARMVQGKCEIVTNFLRAVQLRGLPRLSEAQNHALMQAGLEAILGSGLARQAFPSFIARETFAPF